MGKLLSIAAVFLAALFEPLFRGLSNYVHRSGMLLASSSFPNGTIFSIGTAYAAVKAISAITNANPGVASCTGNGYSNGDIVLLAMPSRLDSRPARVSSDATDSFSIEGIDTTSTTLYPSGFGAGTASKVTTFVPLSQVTDLQSSGGEQQFAQWVYLEDGRQRQRPTFKNARTMTLKLDYDSTLSWHAALLAADIAQTPYVLLATLPNGAKIYYGVYVGYDGEPNFTINQNQQVTASFALASPVSTRYAS